MDPGPEEVRDITEAHAERLTGLVRAARAGPTSEVDAAHVRAAVELYAKDFGQPAADQLLAHCRRRAVLERSTPLSIPIPS